jgi:PPOX class probable F420-dependent enzyme
MNKPNELASELLSRNEIATFATHNPDGSIHLTALWFMFEDGDVYIGTFTGSRKVSNLRRNPEASLMVDARGLADERGVAVTGTAEIITGEASRDLNRRIHARYLSEEARIDPRVGPVLADMDDATIRLRPRSFVTWDSRPTPEDPFGGLLAKPGYLLPRD